MYVAITTFGTNLKPIIMKPFKFSRIDFKNVSNKDILSFIELKKEQQNNLIKLSFKLPFHLSKIEELQNEINYLNNLLNSN